ncbi:MAG: gliding motility-associated C-terminal domain-containing protein [Cyclobacteriaceae bacterium]|nr:gliding motility-associated C-terminal domain-containing protein [Cyclobacteriaceae bacterium]
MRRTIFFTVYVSLMLILPGRSLAGAGHEDQIQFIRNQGQWDPEILYQAKLHNGYLQVSSDGLHYLFFDGSRLDHHHGNNSRDGGSGARSGDPEDVHSLNMHATALVFKGRSDNMNIIPGKPQEVYYNYFIGKDRTKWAGKVPVFAEIHYTSIYPGIDMKLYSSGGYIKYDLVVEPGADISQIAFEYDGLESIELRNNSILAETSINTITENTPFAYQLVGGDTLKINCRFRLDGSSVSYDLPDGFNPDHPLIIDPLLIFSTYSGSSADNWGNTATYDNAGNVYSGGTVRMEYGGSLPVTNRAFQQEFGGIWDLAILKFDSTGSKLLYGTYLGGSGTETPFSMIVNHQDELVIFGVTGSPDFPMGDSAYDTLFNGGETVTNAIGNYNSGFQGVDYLSGSDLFIARLSADGSHLLAATYLGGTGNEGINNAEGFPLSRNYGDEFRGEVIVDEEDNIYLAGNTSSIDFPIVQGFQQTYGGGTQDAIMAKLNTGLSELIWSTYLGGSLADAAYGIRLAENGRIYGTGGTMSEDFPVSSNTLKTSFGGDVDGFVTALSSNGDSLVAGTFLGTDLYDQSYFLDIDQQGYIYTLGQTKGNYPVSPDVYANPLSGQFIHKLSPGLDQSIFSTVIGSGSGVPDISLTAFLVNECGNIFLSGWGGDINSPSLFGRSIPKYNGGNTFNMPITGDAFQKVTDGSDFYLMVLERDAEKLLYATFLGALNTGSGEHVDGGTSRFDKRGIVYHALCACRDNSQFPTTPGVWSSTNQSPGGCNNGVFKFDLSSLQAAFTTDSHEFDKPGVIQDCYPFEVVFLNKSIGGISYEWDFGDGNTSDQPDSIFYLYEEPGVYDVSLTAYDENTCLKVDVATARLGVFEPFFEVPSDQLICQYDEVELKAAGSLIYRWEPAEGLSDPDIANPMASPDTTTTYHLYMKDDQECELEDSVKVSVIPRITADFDYQKIYDCATHPSLLIANRSLMGNRYIWDYGDGNMEELEDSIFNYHFDNPGTYTIRMFASLNGLCTQVREEKVNISEIFVPNIVTPNQDGKNEAFTILTDAPVSLKIYNRWGKTVYENMDYRNNWNASDLSAGVYYYEIVLEDDATCKGWIQVMR